MKRTLSILFLAFYLLFSYGVLISAHYCGGKMVDLEFMKKAKSCCGDEKKLADCCSNDDKVIFLDDNQLETKSVVITTPVKDLSIQLIAPKTQDLISNVETDYYHYTDLPPPDEEEAFMLYCSFTFYG